MSEYQEESTMMNRTYLAAAVLVCGLGVATSLSQGQAVTATTAASTAPKVEVDLKTPEAALATYFRAQQAMDATTIKNITAVTDATKAKFVTVLINYILWNVYLERTAVAKYGAAEGVKVLGHDRSLDDQLKLDLRRVLEPTIDYNANHDQAKVFLRVERNRPDGLQTDRFTYLDEYAFIKQGADWKLDYLKTYKCEDAEQSQLELGVFPPMTKVMKDLAEDIKAGKIRDADVAHNIYQAKLNALNGDDKVPDDKPAEKKPE